MSVERSFLIRQAYQRSLTALRQKYDAEFQQMLAEQYEQMGLEVAKRKSRVASRNTDTEGDTDG
jgi:hypothetical protein